MPVLIKWNPASHLFASDEPNNHVVHQVSNLLCQRKSERMSAWMPIADMYETDTTVTLHIELAGVERESLEIVFENGVLMIQGTRPFHEHFHAIKIHRIERMYGVFYRAFQIPAPVDAQAITASYERGMLTITLPKQAQRHTEQRNVPITFT